MKPTQAKFDSSIFDPSTRNLDPALERLKRFHPAGMALTLGRVHRLLAALGNPEKKLPPVFHVGGTNGKGSTVAFLRAILEASGTKIHAYTSPHLIKYNERIRLAGALIDDERLATLIEEVEEANANQEISFFEITTAMALYEFARQPADAVLLEVGLGGMFDATNVIDHPIATAITRISYDHTQILGDRIEQIAGEKAGIMKPGVPAILAGQKEQAASEVIRARAKEISAPLFEYGSAWAFEPAAQGFKYQDEYGAIDLPLPGLAGAHQLMNAATAIAMLRHADGFESKALAFAPGLQQVEWPARLQRLTTGPLAALLPAGWELWLDGGHNDSGGEVLADQAALWRDMPLSLVFGMLGTKNADAFLTPLAPYVAQLRAVFIPDEPLSLTADQAAEAAVKAGITAKPADNPQAAISDLATSGSSPQRILICGSLYLAGKILAISQ